MREKESGVATASIGAEISEILLERYPDLFLQLHYAEPTPEGAPLKCVHDLEAVLQKIPLSALSTLYVYGVGGEYYERLQEWLQQDVKRRLIFLDDRRLYWIHSPWAMQILSDPQVVIHPCSQENFDPQPITSLFPCEAVEVLPFYLEEGFETLRLALLRASALAHTAIIESLGYDKLLANILPHIHSWKAAFLANGLKGKFRGIPAVICGAGPSLSEILPHLQGLEDRALILAGGSAITALSNQGITPHLGLAFDPNPEEFERLKNASAYAMPLIYGTRLSFPALNTLNGELGYLVSATGGPCEEHFEKVLGICAEAIGPELGMEALSVTTMNIALAVAMGCSPILLGGIDLAYSGMQRYAPGVMANSEMDEDQIASAVRALDKSLQRTSSQGDCVSTLTRWVMESECIAAFAQQHPEVRFINLTQAGLGFDGIPYQSLREVMQEELFPSYDLRGLVHAEICQLKLPFCPETCAHEMEKMDTSLLRLKTLITSLIEELERMHQVGESHPTTTLTLLELDVQEEIAFSALNPFVGAALERLLSRRYPAPQEGLNLPLQIDKMQRWQSLVQRQLQLGFSGTR